MNIDIEWGSDCFRITPLRLRDKTAMYSLDRTDVDWIPWRFSCKRDISFSSEGPLGNFCSEDTGSEERL